MRPGRLTPENDPQAASKGHFTHASMRPGRLTPENESHLLRFSARLDGFNEAGAINPGKLPISAYLPHHPTLLQ